MSLKVGLAYRGEYPQQVEHEFSLLMSALQQAWGLDAFQPGMGAWWFTSTPPTGWALLNGQAISRSDNPVLFRLWGVSFGAGDGSTTFNIPNMTATSTYLIVRLG